MPLITLTIFEIQNLMLFIQETIYLKTKDGVYVIDKFKSIETRWIALNVNGDNVT